jgi:hypothetical protein
VLIGGGLANHTTIFSQTREQIQGITTTILQEEKMVTEQTTDDAGVALSGAEDLSGEDYQQFMSFLEQTLYAELQAEGSFTYESLNTVEVLR